MNGAADEPLFPQDDLPELTSVLVQLRKKPGTEARFKAYPAMLQRFGELLEACEDPAILHEVLRRDEGYYLLAGYRQRVIERLLGFGRTPDVLRIYAMQLTLFGDVDAFGEADTETDARVEALEAEADALDGLA